MALTEVDLPRQASTRKNAKLYATEKFDAKKLMEVLKIHRSQFSCLRNHIILQDED